MIGGKEILSQSIQREREMQRDISLCAYPEQTCYLSLPEAESMPHTLNCHKEKVFI